MLSLDHLVITAPTLDIGTQWAETRLGLPLGPGGEHALMGTHNRLLSLGPGLYLEVIAINPAAPAPAQARWFGLDDGPSAPRLSHWACRCDTLEAALAQAPAGHGQPTAFARGALRWRMALTDRLPFDDCYPALLSWQTPPPNLPDQGARLARLHLSHPQAPDLAQSLAAQLTDPRLSVTTGPPGLSATIDTPKGPRRL